MSKVTITLEDCDGGQMDIKMRFDPEVKKGEPRTPAQELAIQLLDAISHRDGD